SIGFDFLINRFESSIDKSDETRAEQIIARINEEYPNRAEGLFAEARLHKFKREMEPYLKKLTVAVEYDPLNENVFEELENYLVVERDFKFLINVCDNRFENAKSNSSNEKQVSMLINLSQACLQSAKSGNIEDFAKAYKGYQMIFKLSDAKSQRRKILEHWNKIKAQKTSKDRLPLPDGAFSLFEDGGASIMLGIFFNYSESLRNCRDAIILDKNHQDSSYLTSLYKDIISMYTLYSIYRPMTSDMLINYKQAMHIPFAMVGKIDEAQKLLREVQESLMTIDADQELFCVANYLDIPSTDFADHNRIMLQALDQNKLWDGTELKTASAKE
ncbi:hypothetical protein N8546_01390, partial [bacterium]|nr:hypothetical protein [bacterium]